jgi:hypothetical protein
MDVNKEGLHKVKPTVLNIHDNKPKGYKQIYSQGLGFEISNMKAKAK